jgi:hypothetical protein
LAPLKAVPFPVSSISSVEVQQLHFNLSIQTKEPSMTSSSSSMALLVLCLLPLQFFLVVLAADPPYGQLKVSGGKLVGSNGQAVALHGMSLFWSSFSEGSPFYTADVVKQLKCSWNANLVRAAMGVEEGSGYLSNKQGQLSMVETVIKAAIAEGIYVLVDWHDHNAQNHQSQVKKLIW